MNDEKEVQAIKKECGWECGLNYPIGDPRNKDFFEADAQKVLAHGKAMFEKGYAEARERSQFHD